MQITQVHPQVSKKQKRNLSRMVPNHFGNNHRAPHPPTRQKWVQAGACQLQRDGQLAETEPGARRQHHNSYWEAAHQGTGKKTGGKSPSSEVPLWRPRTHLSTLGCVKWWFYSCAAEWQPWQSLQGIRAQFSLLRAVNASHHLLSPQAQKDLCIPLKYILETVQF